MKPQEYVKYHVLTWNIGVFKNSFMFFIMKQHESSMKVCYGMNKCGLWNVQILIKLKEHKNSFNKVQAKKMCKNYFVGWDTFIKKLGFLSCMNIMKEWLHTFSKWKTFFGMFFFLIYVHDTMILWLWKEGGDEVNIKCLFLKPLKCLLQKKNVHWNSIMKILELFP